VVFSYTDAVEDVKVYILLTRGKHFHDRIILLRREVWAYKASLSLPLFIAVALTIQEREQYYICIRGIDFASFHDFGRSRSISLYSQRK
jgi:hypothetical protein